MQLVVLPIEFRSVGDALLAGRIDLGITVADELPAGMRRVPLFVGGFTCLYDPKAVRLPKRLTLERYLAEEHVIVSYNGDLRGVVEDLLGMRRRVRISVPTFQHVGSAVDGTGLIATVPEMVARDLRKTRPQLRTAELPFRLSGIPMELVWRGAADDDGALGFVRARIVELAAQFAKPKPKPKASRAREAPSLLEVR